MVVNLVPYSIAASGSLLVYDTLCTFRYEVDYVWSQTLSLGGVLFLLNRYLPFIDTFISLDLLSRGRVTPELCKSHFRVVTWFILFGTLIAEVTLMLRTWAIWQRSRAIFVTLSVVFIVVVVPSIVVTQIELDSLVYGPSEAGCRLLKASSIIFLAYVLLMVSESLIAGLTLYKAIQHVRYSSSHWVHKMYKEGILFYFYLLVISTANVVVPVAAPSKLANWLATPQRVLHSILCTRVLLSILISRARRNRNVHWDGSEGSSRRHAEVSSTPLEFETISVPVISTDWDEEEESVMGYEWDGYQHNRNMEHVEMGGLRR